MSGMAVHVGKNPQTFSKVIFICALFFLTLRIHLFCWRAHFFECAQKHFLPRKHFLGPRKHISGPRKHILGPHKYIMSPHENKLVRINTFRCAQKYFSPRKHFFSARKHFSMRGFFGRFTIFRLPKCRDYIIDHQSASLSAGRHSRGGH